MTGKPSDLRLEPYIYSRLDVNGQEGDCIERIHTLKGCIRIYGPMARTPRHRSALLAALAIASTPDPHFPARVREGESRIGSSVLPIPHTSTEGYDLTMLDRLRRSKPQVRGGLTTP
jgi:hypothetical protein